MRRGVVHCLCGVTAASCLSMEVRAAESEVSSLSHTTSSGFYYSRGLYGEAKATRIRYAPVSHEVSTGPWRARAALSRVEITGPGNVLVNVGNIGSSGDGLVSASGTGDALLNLTYELPAMADWLPFFDVGVEIKLPLADERKGLGTGKVDSSVQLDAYQPVGSVTLFGTVAWKYRQSSGLFPQLRNSWLLSVGASVPLSDSTQIGFFYDYQQAVSDFSGATREWVPYFNWSVSDRWSLMFYAVEGATDDSANRAGGIQLSLRW